MIWIREFLFQSGLGDPVPVFRDGWRYLVGYYVIAAFTTLALRFVLRPFLSMNSLKTRIVWSAILAALFTPSIVSDFWLFSLPGPAVVGLAMTLLTGMLSGALAYPTGTVLFVLVISVAYLIPLLLGFGVAYSFMWLGQRRFSTPS
jgi:hypothetical protein